MRERRYPLRGWKRSVVERASGAAPRATRPEGAVGGMNAASKARRPLRVLIAPDSFKGSFSSVGVAAALARGWVRARPDDGVAVGALGAGGGGGLGGPRAEGGEGALGRSAPAGAWSRRSGIVGVPLGRPVRARWLRPDHGKRAVVQLA